MDLDDLVQNDIMLYLLEAGSRGFHLEESEDITSNLANIGILKRSTNRDRVLIIIYIGLPTYRSFPLCQVSLSIWEDIWGSNTSRLGQIIGIGHSNNGELEISVKLE